jgi:hypothetical protein
MKGVNVHAFFILIQSQEQRIDVVHTAKKLIFAGYNDLQA